MCLLYIYKAKKILKIVIILININKGAKMKFKNYRNSYTNDDRIYSFDDIYNMKFGDVLRNKKELLAQYCVLGVPTESELRGSENVVYVNAYTRDDGTEVKAHWRSRPDGITSNNLSHWYPTGGASEIKYGREQQRDVPPMTKGAELQENVIKNMPILEVKSNPEQEYYRIAFELKKAKETGKIPEWMKEHNDIRTLDKIGNEENKKALKEKII